MEYTFTYANSTNQLQGTGWGFHTHPDRTAPYAELHEKRKTLNEGLKERGYFPDAQYPADCFIAESAGLNVNRISSRGSLGRKGWFEITGYDSRTERTTRRWHRYSDEAQAIIDEWWDLLSPEVRTSEYGGK